MNDQLKRQYSKQTANNKKKKVTAEYLVEFTDAHPNLDSFAGIESCLKQLIDLVVLPLKQPHLYKSCGITPPTGILLHGPSGSGKTALALALGKSVDVPFFLVPSPSLISGMSGDSEKKIRQIFQLVKDNAPSILFIDEIDCIAQKRESGKGMDQRIVAQFMSSLDDLSFEKSSVIVLAATNRPDLLDPALRRAGRFDREVLLNIPSEQTRLSILRKLIGNMSCKADLQFISKRTGGFVGADLQSLVSTASLRAIKRQINIKSVESIKIIKELMKAVPLDVVKSFSILQDDFMEALKHVQPSALREGFATVPNVTFDDIGAHEHLIKEMNNSVLEPIIKRELYAQFGIKNPTGILLWGPPGCGKTLLAKATANACGCNFVSVKGPELLNKYVGESEKAVRIVFSRARASAPCLIFFDEIDALCPKRDDSKSEATQRVVNTLLTELDGVDGRDGVFVLAATNRPDIIDPALLRPGRIDKLKFVPLPTVDDRQKILKTLCRSLPLDKNLNFDGIADMSKGYSGADLNALVREASSFAIRLNKASLDMSCFNESFKNMRASVADEDHKEYLRLKQYFGQ
eukprot:NODE_65_length_25825_cov_1.353844.p4 type:complete len:576 gc:universal NODE_65_length_25825_cov_1.353844:17960-19687(+)